MAPPRTYKTAFLADVILRYPGPVIATTTKADIYALTAAVRAGLGPVHVFNPQHIGGVTSTFRWNPVDGCQDPATAIRRADAFAFAVAQKGVEDGTFWSAKASDYLRGYFHAAAIAGYDLRTVATWVTGAEPHVPEGILNAVGARQWALTLAELRSEAQRPQPLSAWSCQEPCPSWPIPPWPRACFPHRVTGSTSPPSLPSLSSQRVEALATIFRSRPRPGPRG